MSNVEYTELRCLPPEATGQDEPLVLEHSLSRKWKAIAITFTAVIWNAITWAFLYFMIRDWVIIGMIFMSIFFLIGLLLIWGAIHSILQLFNPKTVVACSQSHIYPGSEFEISWIQKGNAARIKRLTIAIEAYEEVTYRQGTDTRTEKGVFFSQILVSSENPDEIASGYRVFELPKDTMHTFRASRNKIEWLIRVHGDIPMWPDISDDFSFTVLPAQVTGDAA